MWREINDVNREINSKKNKPDINWASLLLKDNILQKSDLPSCHRAIQP
jgi:hypothetical protein